jgi:hypothetical protein
MPSLPTLRRLANLLNLSTPAGLALAVLAGCELHAGPRRLVLATGYALAAPDVPAFTVGNVVLTPHDLAHLLEQPGLLAHEDRHATQYVWCLGLPLLPLYAAGVGPVLYPEVSARRQARAAAS